MGDKACYNFRRGRLYRDLFKLYTREKLKTRRVRGHQAETLAQLMRAMHHLIEARGCKLMDILAAGGELYRVDKFKDDE